jgi:hypothetical protein
MRCSQIRQLLNNPKPIDDPALLDHISQCASCREAWEAETLLRNNLASARVAPSEAPWGSAGMWVDRTIREEKESIMKSLLRHPFISRPRRWGWSLAAAGVALAFLVLVPFAYEHTVGTRLVITSADPAMTQINLDAIKARLAEKGFGDVVVARSNDAGSPALTYYVHGSSMDASNAFAVTRDLVPAAAASGKVAIEPWRVRESGSLLAQISARVFEVKVSSEGKTDEQITEEIRSQLASQGMQVKSVSYTRDASGQTTIQLEGDVNTPQGEAQVKIEDVRMGAAPDGQVETKIVLAAPDSNLSDAEKIAQIKQQLAEQGITDAEVTIKDGKIEVKAEKKTP